MKTNHQLLFPMILVIAALVYLSSFGTSGIAKDATPTAGKTSRSYTPPYGMAGCGFGALVIDRNELLPQFGAWFLNSLYGNQTYAISSGTSKCDGGVSLAQHEREIFMKANLAAIEKDAVRGEGEYLKGLAQMFGCPDDLASNFNALSKSRYLHIFATDSAPAGDGYRQVLRNFELEVARDAVLGQSCRLSQHTS